MAQAANTRRFSVLATRRLPTRFVGGAPPPCRAVAGDGFATAVISGHGAHTCTRPHLSARGGRRRFVHRQRQAGSRRLDTRRAEPADQPSVRHAGDHAARSRPFARVQFTHVDNHRKPSFRVSPRARHAGVGQTGDRRPLCQPSRLSVYVTRRGAVLWPQEHSLFVDGNASYKARTRCTSTPPSGARFAMQDARPLTNLSARTSPTTRLFTSHGRLGTTAAPATETEASTPVARRPRTEMLPRGSCPHAQNCTAGACRALDRPHQVNASTTAPMVACGRNNAGNWYLSLDVVGHYIGHGVDNTTPSASPARHLEEVRRRPFGAATAWFAAERHRSTGRLHRRRSTHLSAPARIRVIFEPSPVKPARPATSSAIPRRRCPPRRPRRPWFFLLAECNHPDQRPSTSPTCNQTVDRRSASRTPRNHVQRDARNTSRVVPERYRHVDAPL